MRVQFGKRSSRGVEQRRVSLCSFCLSAPLFWGGPWEECGAPFGTPRFLEIGLFSERGTLWRSKAQGGHREHR